MNTVRKMIRCLFVALALSACGDPNFLCEDTLVEVVSASEGFYVFKSVNTGVRYFMNTENDWGEEGDRWYLDTPGFCPGGVVKSKTRSLQEVPGQYEEDGEMVSDVDMESLKTSP